MLSIVKASSVRVVIVVVTGSTAQDFTSTPTDHEIKAVDGSIIWRGQDVWKPTCAVSDKEAKECSSKEGTSESGGESDHPA